MQYLNEKRNIYKAIALDAPALNILDIFVIHLPLHILLLGIIIISLLDIIIG